jgi:hypothetical protein
VNKKLRDAAVMKLVSFKIDHAPVEEVVTLLMPMTDERSSWRLEAKELLALLFIREGNLDKAKSIYNEIVNDEAANSNIRSRAKDMMTALEQLGSTIQRD